MSVGIKTNHAAHRRLIDVDGPATFSPLVRRHPFIQAGLALSDRSWHFNPTSFPLPRPPA